MKGGGDQNPPTPWATSMKGANGSKGVTMVRQRMEEPLGTAETA